MSGHKTDKVLHPVSGTTHDHSNGQHATTAPAGHISVKRNLQHPSTDNPRLNLLAPAPFGTCLECHVPHTLPTPCTACCRLQDSSAYHSYRDTVERMRPGILQASGGGGGGGEEKAGMGGESGEQGRAARELVACVWLCEEMWRGVVSREPGSWACRPM